MNAEQFCAPISGSISPHLSVSRARANGAQERTRTFTAVKPLAPEASASTNSATWARSVGSREGASLKAPLPPVNGPRARPVDLPPPRSGGRGTVRWKAEGGGGKPQAWRDDLA